jgi:hypothetical protein
MPLSEFKKNLDSTSDWRGCSNAGLFNVETGYASFRTSWVGECDCSSSGHSAMQYDCVKCGKTVSNNLSVPSGDGDGLYTVVSFVNQRGEVFATATLFDYDSTLAKAFIREIEDEKIRDFRSVSTLFDSDHLGIRIGSLEASPDRVIHYSDASAGMNSSMATVTVDNWVPGGVSAFAFVEKSIDGALAQVAIRMGADPELFNGGLESSLRPRLILLISDTYQSLTNNLEDMEMSEAEWAEQIEAWSKQQVTSHVRQQSSVAIYWNGRLENEFASIASQNGLPNHMEHFFKEFSWYLQGATFGDEDCAEYVSEMVAESNGELNELDLLRDAYLLRGLVNSANAVSETAASPVPPVTPDVNDLPKKSQARGLGGDQAHPLGKSFGVGLVPGAVNREDPESLSSAAMNSKQFCTDCGAKFATGQEKFCGSCGSPR